jgi:hypothetical protein
LETRIKEIKEGRFDDEWNRILSMNEQELTELCAKVK